MTNDNFTPLMPACEIALCTNDVANFCSMWLRHWTWSVQEVCMGKSRRCLWRFFSSTLYKDVLDSHASIKSKQVRGDQLPWIAPEIQRHIFCPNKLYKIHKKNPSSTTWDANKVQRNKVTSLKRKAVHTDHVIRDSRSVAECVNSYFVNVANRETEVLEVGDLDTHSSVMLIMGGDRLH